MSKLFGFEVVSIDLNSLLAVGHSYGGATALYSAYHDKRIKQVFGLDPWMFPIDEKILKEKILDIPLVFIMTESYYRRLRSMKQKEKTELFFSTHEKHSRNKILLHFDKTAHLNQVNN